MSPRLLHLAMYALCAILALFASSAADGPGFRRFAKTGSPDGAYALAWGTGGGRPLAELREWPIGTDTRDDAGQNFLVDAISGKVLAEIPGHDHFMTGDGIGKQFGSLTVSWSDDSQRALAIYGGRWSDDSILWIDPKKRTFTEVVSPLMKATREFLTKKEKIGNLDDEEGVTFDSAKLLPGGVLMINVRAKPKITRPDSYDYRLRFSVRFDGNKPACTLVSGVQIPDAPGEEKSADFKVEAELNKAYQTLRAKLNDADRAVLKEKQLQWLKERDAISDEAERMIFTRIRTAYLQGRAEN